MTNRQIWASIDYFVPHLLLWALHTHSLAHDTSLVIIPRGSNWSFFFVLSTHVNYPSLHAVFAYHCQSNDMSQSQDVSGGQPKVALVTGATGLVGR